MRKRPLLLAALIVAFAALILYAHNLVPADIGREIVIIRPVVAGSYDHAGKPARDDEILYGMSGTIIGDGDTHGNYLIRTEYGHVTLVPRSGVLLRSRASTAWRSPPTHLVAGAFADVKSAADLRHHPLLMVLPRGSRLRVTGDAGDYHAVQLHDGRQGYVRKALLRPLHDWTGSDEETNRSRVTADALAYVGTSYRWGGKTPYGIDCSGLASMAYMMNGLHIFRNSRPEAGYPLALLHLDTPPGGHTRQSLARAKPGDILYWEGHQGVYIGDGKFVHANATSYNVRVDSLLGDDSDRREDLAEPGAILTWGTAYPERPGELAVRRFAALPTAEKNGYRFFARLEGYAPTRATLYPEGEGAGKPAIVVENPGPMVFGAVSADNPSAPEYRYSNPGTYRPAIVFANEGGWLPGGEPIVSEVFTLPEPIVVK